jgi:hypothetical protein
MALFSCYTILFSHLHIDLCKYSPVFLNSTAIYHFLLSLFFINTKPFLLNKVFPSSSVSRNILIQNVKHPLPVYIEAPPSLRSFRHPSHLPSSSLKPTSHIYNVYTLILNASHSKAYPSFCSYTSFKFFCYVYI